MASTATPSASVSSPGCSSSRCFDQREEDWEDDDPKYRSPLPESCRWRNWAAYEVDHEGKKKPKMSGSEVIAFVNNELFPALKEDIVASRSPLHRVIKQVFEDANNYMKSGQLMLAVIEKLDEAIDFHDFKTRANLGDVYEQILNDLRSAGNAGEFYTPRAITQFMVAQVNPSLAKRETVLDPACGTGGFLTAAIDHFRHALERMSSPRPEDQRAIEELIHGIEKKQLPHLLCITNLMLHGIDVPSRIGARTPWPRHGTNGARTTRLTASSPIRPSAAMRKTPSAATSRPTCAPARRPTCSWPSSSRSC